MRFDVITLFPKSFFGPFSESIAARAIRSGLLAVNLVDLRGFASGGRKAVDDSPYGGGPGMLMAPEPLFRAVESLRSPGCLTVYTSPSGLTYNQRIAEQLAGHRHIILICGHYEGVDQRVRDALVDVELSIGDFILTNGNIPAMAIIDSVARLLPGVLHHPDSNKDDSFSSGLLECPQYTKPAEFRGMGVPPVLLSGDHGAIARWRIERAREWTAALRPDLLASGGSAPGLPPSDT